MNISTLREDYTETADSGDRVGDYVISTREVEISLYTTKTTYTLNKHFAQLKKYAAILEEYRQYAIPNQNLVRSQRTIHGFAKLNTLDSLPAAQTSDSEFDKSSYIDDGELNLFKMSMYNIALPAVSYNMNNTLIFETEFETNAVAGYRITPTSDADYYKEVPVKYADSNGMINDYSTLAFGKDFASFDSTTSHDLPKYTGGLSTTFFSDYRLVEKDAREQLAFSLQVHHIVENPIIHVNDGFSRENGLIGGKGLNHPDLKVAFFDIRPERTKFLTSPQYMIDIADVLWDTDADTIFLTRRTNNAPVGADSWGIVDTTNREILMWVDEPIEVGAKTSSIVITTHKDY